MTNSKWGATGDNRLRKVCFIHQSSIQSSVRDRKTLLFPPYLKSNTKSPLSLKIEVPQTVQNNFALKANTPKFGSAAVGGDAFRFIVQNLYGRGEAVRYAVEQTLGYTVPRTVQQLNRTKEITGENNHMAAKEMLVRDLAADVMDTFAPGLIATHLIGRGIDVLQPSFVKANFDEETIQFFKSLAKLRTGEHASRTQFFQRIEQRLKNAAESHLGENCQKTVLNLEKQFNAALKNKKLWEALPATLAQKLKLPDFDLVMQHNTHTPGNTKSVSTTIPKLLDDLKYLVEGVRVNPTSSGWGHRLEQMMTNTWKAKPWQMGGNIAALAGSISIPFIVRAITKMQYGKDAFPGSYEIQKHFQKQQQLQLAARQNANNPSFSQLNPPEFESLEMSGHNKKWRWFPYLTDSYKKGNALPTLLSAGFIGVLGAAVFRRFKVNQGSITKFRDWVKVYQFDRGWPWTSVTQMELTYGLLCGMRLAASRNDSEFRETAIRDCLLGWPTLTYFYDWFRPWLAKNYFTPALTKKFGNPYLLMKHNGELRRYTEISKPMFNALKLKNTAQAATKAALKSLDKITIFSAGLSWVLLAWAEPKLGIWLTNTIETAKIKKQQAVA